MEIVFRNIPRLMFHFFNRYDDPMKKNLKPLVEILEKEIKPFNIVFSSEQKRIKSPDLFSSSKPLRDTEFTFTEGIFIPKADSFDYKSLRIRVLLNQHDGIKDCDGWTRTKLNQILFGFFFNINKHVDIEVEIPPMVWVGLNGEDLKDALE